MSTPLVSIIVPTHNRPILLLDTLNSIVAQTYCEVEAITVNDGGIPVEHVVQEVRKTGIRITYACHASNRGLAAARNTGLRLAAGDYVTFLDDDDCLDGDYVARLVSAMVESGAKVAYCDARCVLEAPRLWRGYQQLCEFPWPSRKFDRDDLLASSLAPPHCFMVKTKCARDVGGFDERLSAAADWDFWIRLSRDHDFLHVPRPLVSYRVRVDGTNMSFGNLHRQAAEHHRVMMKHRALVAQQPELREKQRAVYEGMVHHAENNTTPLDYLIWRERAKRRQRLLSLPVLSGLASCYRACRRAFRSTAETPKDTQPLKHR